MVGAMSGYLYIGDPVVGAYFISNAQGTAVPVLARRQHVKAIEDVGNGFVTLRNDDGNYINHQASGYGLLGTRNFVDWYGPWEQWKVQGNSVVSWNGYVYYLARLA